MCGWIWNRLWPRDATGWERAKREMAAAEAQEAGRTARATGIAERARKSRATNGYADALRHSMQKRD